jgi:hypothetical protein
MKKVLLSIAMVALFSGCVVTASPRVAVQGPDVVVYPHVEVAYLWDPVRVSFYFVERGHRYYMPRGWEYRRHGLPPGPRYHLHNHDDWDHRGGHWHGHGKHDGDHRGGHKHHGKGHH